ncbi:MAG: hypothetical protein LBJ11_00140 [Oscillospiraceae bacterium]|jgi:uroporphyrinogen decarboxylase|nr:hypothetical protein [Oscillospiraceae bacterium]
MSPEHFRHFLLSAIRRLANVAHRHGKCAVMHSCGSIYRVIPDLIDAGIDVLHPLQAQAAGMSAKELAQYKNDLAFIGGVDAQGILTTGTPRQVHEEAERVWDILGPNLILSPSHEEVLPNVPPENTLALA